MDENALARALPVPAFFDPEKVGEVWRVPYQERATQAREWAESYGLRPASVDDFRIALVLVDVQNTFCIPGFELFVGGRSGVGAVEDNRRLCQFIYRNLARLTRIKVTMDTHFTMQIFHPVFLVDKDGKHPDPYTLVRREDLQEGRWRFNAAVGEMLGLSAEYGQRHLEHYVKELEIRQKFDLTIWPYHAMLGGIGHALVSSVEEAIFFHSLARYSQPEFEIKGRNPLTEHYSAVGPEVVEGPDGKKLAEKSKEFLQMTIDFDALIICGQAKSHCVAWTVSDLLADIRAHDASLAHKVYLLQDCSSPVVVPGAVDYTDAADVEYRRFAEAGMHVVQTDQALEEWPGMPPV
jgi:nicotinamidase-related amidase